MTHPDLIERLNRKHRVHSGTGGGSISYDKDDNMVVSSYVTDDGMRLVNPDGPEALSLLHRLSDDRGLTDTLESRISFLRATLTKGEGGKP